MSLFLPRLLHRAYTLPPESQPSHWSLAPRLVPKACCCGIRASHHDGFGNYSHISWKREQSRHARRVANPSAPQHAPYTKEDGIHGFERLESQFEVPDGDDEMTDLSLWDDSSTRDSQIPDDSTAQLRTPSPVRVVSSFEDCCGEGHEIAGVNIETELSAESEDAVDAEGRPDTTKWTRDRLRIRPEIFPAVFEEHINLSIDGALMKSIERDPTVAPVPIEDLGSSYEYHHQTRSCGASESEEEGYESDEWDVRGITGERIGPGVHEYRIEWQEFEGQCWPLEWIPAENCTNCAEAIADFRSLQRESLSAARRAGRTEEVQRLQQLADAYQIEIDNTILPKNLGWRIQRRSVNGRFVTRGTNNSVLEIIRENTAKAPSRRHFAHPLDGDRASTGDEVVWVFSHPKEGRRFQQLGEELEADGTTVFHMGRSNDDLKRAEVQRRLAEDAKEQTRVAAKRTKRAKRNIARKEKQRRAKACQNVVKRPRMDKAQERKKMGELAKRDASRKGVEKKSRDKHQVHTLEDNLQRGCRLTVVINRRLAGGISAPNCSKNQKLHQTLTDASESAAQRENARLQAALINEARSSSLSSVLTINSRFRRVRAEEARERANEEPSLVRSEFRAVLGESHVEDLVKKIRLVLATSIKYSSK